MPILEAPEGRRDDFVDPYFRHANTDEVVVILKAREPARMMIAIGKDDHWHLQLVQRWIIQYNFYVIGTGAGCSFGCVLISPFQTGCVSISING